jgi:outer membrane exchange protein TraA
MRVPVWLLAVMVPAVSVAKALGEPVAPPPTNAGGGLCSFTVVSTSPATDFPQQSSAYDDGMNAFFDASLDSGAIATVPTAVDFSNGAFGDFVSAQPGCPDAGCPFAYDDTTTSFGVRLRGFVSLPEPGNLHVGAYADDAVSVTLFDQTGYGYHLITQPPVLGAPAWRTTSTASYADAGLYAVEILYAQIVTNALLEVSQLQAPFTDFQAVVTQDGGGDLADAGFTLIPTSAFYQTESGSPAPAGSVLCLECLRANVGLSGGDGGCPDGYYCNAAALCAPESTRYPPPDGGADAGGTDAGAPLDAGASSDAGSGTPTSSGCGCTTMPNTLGVALGAALLVVASGRRRRQVLATSRKPKPTPCP